MPSGAFHSFYWQTQTPEPPIAAGGSGSGGYPPWQMTILGSLLFIIVLVG